MRLANKRSYSEFSELAGFYSGKRILITGSAGYLATNLVELLRKINCFVIGLDRTGGSSASLGGSAKIQYVVGDVREPPVWEQVLDGIDVVFHFAAQTSAYVANQDPLSDLDSNVKPMLHLLETCRHQGIHPTVLFSSTVTIAGIPTRLPVDETHPDNPLTIYDLHKLIAEQYLRSYARLGIVKGAALRLANVYGPGPASSRSDRGILNQMVRKAIAGESLTVYRPGDRLRDYVYIEDVVWAFAQAGCKISQLNSQYFVIGSGQGHTIAQAISLVADRVALRTGIRTPIVYVDPPSEYSPIEDRNFVADSHYFSQETGWQACYSLTEGIDRT
ncbi:MAG: hypothetical protein C0410_09155, partial [Anaerolinea sp.]|nr:hypothetical protein [Anaerolinea sp.]